MNPGLSPGLDVQSSVKLTRVPHKNGKRQTALCLYRLPFNRYQQLYKVALSQAVMASTTT